MHLVLRAVKAHSQQLQEVGPMYSGLSRSQITTQFIANSQGVILATRHKHLQPQDSMTVVHQHLERLRQGMHRGQKVVNTSPQNHGAEHGTGQRFPG